MRKNIPTNIYKLYMLHNIELSLKFRKITCYSTVDPVTNLEHNFRKGWKQNMNGLRNSLRGLLDQPPYISL